MREARNTRLKEDDGEYITSLARGLAVLRAFSKEHPEMTLSQVAAEVAIE